MFFVSSHIFAASPHIDHEKRKKKKVWFISVYPFIFRRFFAKIEYNLYQ